MPIHPTSQVKSVNSPYSVKDYKAVGTEYGTLNDIRNLIPEAHTRGIDCNYELDRKSYTLG